MKAPLQHVLKQVSAHILGQPKPIATRIALCHSSGAAEPVIFWHGLKATSRNMGRAEHFVLGCSKVAEFHSHKAVSVDLGW